MFSTDLDAQRYLRARYNFLDLETRCYIASEVAESHLEIIEKYRFDERVAFISHLLTKPWLTMVGYSGGVAFQVNKTNLFFLPYEKDRLLILSSNEGFGWWRNNVYNPHDRSQILFYRYCHISNEEILGLLPEEAQKDFLFDKLLLKAPFSESEIEKKVV